MDSPRPLLEFFAGIGLMHQGLQTAGWQCVYANDLDPHKETLYRSHFGDVDYWHLEDVWNTEAVAQRIEASVDTAALATASFPCTDMSLAGRMEGFAGAESSAFFGFARVLERLGQRKPPVVLLENVAGLLTSRQGDDFRACTQRLAELGYWLDCWRLDARHFVPQSRPRLFIAGYLTPPTDALASRPWQPDELRPERLLKAVELTELATGWRLRTLPEPPQRSNLLEDVIDQDDEQAWWDEPQVQRHVAMMSDDHRHRVEQWQDAAMPRVATAFRRIRKKVQRTEVRFDGLAGCLRTPKGGSARQIVLSMGHGRLRMRWMSPREYARLQGAGDYDWGEARDSRVLFGFGDAVCVPAIRWIAEHALPHTPAHTRI